MRNQKSFTLILIILLGAILRLINLERKPLWLDEIITGLFTFGQGYDVIPRETLFPVETISNLLTYQPQTCSEIAQFLIQESTHPPLFFCLLHQWLGGIHAFSFFEIPLAIQLRSLPVIFGVIAILISYYLNQQAFSQTAGLMSAGIIAVSPFAVYLSQEARQYTLLLILISIALLAFIQILKPVKNAWVYWLLWGISNSLGGYTHYFFILSFVAQTLILVLYFLWKSPRKLFLLFGVIVGIILSYLPWFPALMIHFSSSTTDWLPDSDLFSPIYQLLLGFLVMVITLPVENQPILIQVISGILMLGFGGWLIYAFSLGYRRLLQNKTTKKATFVLSLYLGFVLLQFLFIIYVLDKNISIAPRYNYVFYPAICSLLGASFSVGFNPPLPPEDRFYPPLPPLEKGGNYRDSLERGENYRDSFKRGGVILVGIISSLFVVFNLFFLKPYLPEVTAQRFDQSSDSILIVMGYKDEMDLALGLSYGLAFSQIQDQSLNHQFIFYNRDRGYDRIWQEISQLEIKVSDLWVIGTGLKQVAFPDELGLNNNQQNCQRDQKNYYRIGIPYQRYNCQLYHFDQLVLHTNLLFPPFKARGD